MNTEPNLSPIPNVGDRYTVRIETLASGGDGVAHPGGFTLFVPNGAPGDLLEVEISKVVKNYGVAQIVSLLESGPDRVPTPCPLAEGCAGCQLQHLSYDAQLAAKQQFVRDGLQRIGHLADVPVLPTLGMADPWRYRNKGEFIADNREGRIRLGYLTRGGGDFVPLRDDCPIQHPLSITMLRAVEEIATAEGLPLAQLITRVSPDTGEAQAILVCWEWHERLPAAAAALRERIPQVAGVLWSQVRGRSVVRRTLATILAGKEKLAQHLGRWEYSVSAESFFQINNVQGAVLLGQVDGLAGELSTSLFADGYCGVGTFLIPLGARAARSIGIEEHPTAIRDAGENLTRYAVHDARLYEGRVEKIFPRLARKGRTLDVVVLDPPRKGAGSDVLNSLPALKVQRVILVSCDPATFGRDAGHLAELGYALETVQPIDMFPHTWHVETVALAVKRAKS
ncbi:MAG: 23S rRNA (uracil(1939)-C(5))-methyltransferase RlmD [Armatimonadota bacterium]